MLLAIDVGGTKTRLAVYERNSASINGGHFPKSFTRKTVERVLSRSAPSLQAIISTFLDAHDLQGKIEAACIGVPGPVQCGSVQATNLPWYIREQELSAQTKIPKVLLINDHAATAAAIPFLAADDLVVLHPGQGEAERNVFAVVAPGTGLGQGYMVVDRHGGRHPLPSEGGHIEFAPKTELQIELLHYLSQKFKKRISVERVLCGTGLVNLYSFLRDTKHDSEPPALRLELEAATDKAALITAHALSAEHEICSHVLDMFVQILASYAGDVVLTYLATGGVFLGGGIPPKILPKLQSAAVVSAYLDKGRLSPLVERTPLSVIKDDHAALLGAASLAAELL